MHRIRRAARPVRTVILVVAGLSASCAADAPSRHTPPIAARTSPSVAPTSPASPASHTSDTEPGCDAGGLEIAPATYDGVDGRGYYDFTVTNDGPATCWVGGYFGVSILGADGGVLTDTATRMPTTLEGSRVEQISLVHGDRANFRVVVRELGAQPCPTIGAFRFIPPNMTGTVLVPIPGQDQGGYCGDARVEPTLPAKPSAG